MELSVLPTGEEPIYRQLYDQLSAQILRGDLAPGTPLPPIRRLSREAPIYGGAFPMLSLKTGAANIASE